MELDEEKAYAKSNFDRLLENIPKRLEEREDRFSVLIQRMKTSPTKKLESLYSFMNELYEYSSTYTPCKKGCNDCCNYPISVSEVEIQHIEKNTKRKRNKQYHQKQNFHGLPCPFLINEACSIYHARPFVCRRHVMLTSTNAWCSPHICNDESFPLLQYSSVDSAFDYIRKVSRSLDDFDIRQVFCDAIHHK